MKKRIRFRKLGRTSAHKWAMLRNMVTSLIEHERIVTTVAKAKEVQSLAEKLITMVKRNTPALQQQISADTKQQPFQAHYNAFRALNPIVRTPQATAKAVQVLGPRYRFRQGGYTRILKLSQNRKGDNAPMALIEYVDRPGEVRAARPPAFLQENGGTGDDFWMMSDLDDEIMNAGEDEAEESVESNK